MYNSKNDSRPNFNINYHKEEEALEDSDILSHNDHISIITFLTGQENNYLDSLSDLSGYIPQNSDDKIDDYSQEKEKRENNLIEEGLLTSSYDLFIKMNIRIPMG